MKRSDIAALSQIAQESLDILAGNPKPGCSSDFLAGDLGDRMLDLGIEPDGGNAFCAFYGQGAFEDASEFVEVSKRGVHFEALCSGILSQWRYYSHWNNGPLPDHMRKWFIAALESVVEYDDMVTKGYGLSDEDIDAILQSSNSSYIKDLIRADMEKNRQK